MKLPLDVALGLVVGGAVSLVWDPVMEVGIE